MRRIRFPWRLGSPPRMRGILFCFTVSLLPCGITPAHAGNTFRTRRVCKLCGDHPRACGEYQDQFVLVFYVSGSPPRMRGIQTKTAGREKFQRITPAHAGNTFCSIIFGVGYGDHPRACGEYRGQVHDFGRLLGSPPRMRGILEQLFRISKNQGITPAHAGNTKWGNGDG